MSTFRLFRDNSPLSKSQSFFIIFMLVGACSFGQISGIIRDRATGKPVKEALVFVNGSTLSSTTSKEGSFELHDLPIGFCQLIIYKQGYQVFKSSVNVSQGKSIKVALELNAESNDTHFHKYMVRDQKMEDLKKYFFGNNRKLKFSNPSSLRFTDSVKTDHLLLTEPLIIENPILGYRLYCYMVGVDGGTPTGQLLDNIRFESLKSKELNTIEQWDSNRAKSFWGSPRHFIKSLIAGTSSEEGFQVLDSSRKSVNVEGLFEKSRMPNYYLVKLTEPVEVSYHQYSQEQKKWSLIPNGRIDATGDGLLLSTGSAQINDENKSGKIEELLPINYDPLPNSSTNAIKRFQEKIYIQTDKPYYYPKETIWMKGYVNYEYPQLRDSLSSTVYVELINDRKKVLFSRIAKIEKGSFVADIWLPDSISSGNYNLRAYTNFMRNFSSDALFSKYIRMVSPNERIDFKSPQSLTSESAGLLITTDKAIYTRHEKVTLSLAFKDSSFTSRANLSLAVTDMEQVHPLDGASILSPLFQQDRKKLFNKEGLKYQLEHGISIEGQFFNNENKASSTSLTIIQGKLEDMKRIETDPFGRFFVTGFNFYDSVDCSFQALNKTGNLYGYVVLRPKKSPLVNFLNPLPLEALTITKTTFDQRIFSEYELPKNTLLLKEVTVNSKKITAEKMEWSRKMYTPEHVIYAKDLIMMGNIVQSLESKLIGFGIRFDPNSGTYFIYNFRAYSGSTPPAILVDGNPTTIDRLNLLPPEIVDRVETSSSFQNIYGSPANGVIAIYTKNYSNSDKSNKIQVKKINGYSRPNNFRAPDYTVSKTSPSRDLRSTIYWNPNVFLEANKPASISFFCSDQHGVYRVVAEGVDERGKVLRAVIFIRVAK